MEEYMYRLMLPTQTKASILAMQRIELQNNCLAGQYLILGIYIACSCNQALIGDHYCLDKFFFVFQKHQNKLASLNT